jgi:Putative zincin peptidase
MNCWKTINLSKDVGSQKILFISTLTMVIVFILTYLPINLLLPNVHFKDRHFLLFVLLLVSMIPIHKLLYAFPLILSGCRVSLKIKFFYMLPIFQIRTCHGVRKGNMILSLLSPFFICTSILLLISIYFPAYVHYLCIALAFHIGLCVPDFILIRQIIYAPKTCFIEEFEDGYEILVQK